MSGQTKKELYFLEPKDRGAHERNLLKVVFALRLKAAIEEAAKWQDQLTEAEKTTITFAEARNKVCERIYDKYKP